MVRLVWCNKLTEIRWRRVSNTFIGNSQCFEINPVLNGKPVKLGHMVILFRLEN